MNPCLEPSEELLMILSSLKSYLLKAGSTSLMVTAMGF